MWSEALSLWREGTSIGLRTLSREPVLGLKRVVLPVSYWRTAEFAYALRQINHVRNKRVLDLGSPKELAIILAEEYGISVAATDIMPSAVDLSRRYCRSLGVDGRGRGKVDSEVQDGRALTYQDDEFDAVYTVSVLEHIPGEGDSRAVYELVRVVKPGGRIIITVPYAQTARDTYVDGDVYERVQSNAEPVFFQRHYDRFTLRERLIDPSGCQLHDLEIWSEGAVPAESLLSRFGRFALPLGPLQPFIAAANLRQAEEPVSDRAMAAFLTLEKPTETTDVDGSVADRRG